MIITLKDIGRRYNQEWIFRHLDYTFSMGKRYAILGPNGSGKSTLIKVLTGSLSPSEGQLSTKLQGTDITIDNMYSHISIAAPYMELIEEFTLNEMIDFHFKFKPYLAGYDKHILTSLLGLEKALHKEIKHFSSGMKQRVKLALACCSSSAVVFLDEPTSNLDTQGENWYLDLVSQTLGKERMLIIGSNQEKEYSFCEERIDVMKYKGA